jgi:hypothetical protein
MPAVHSSQAVKGADMKIMVMVLAVCITTELLGGQPTEGANNVRPETVDLLRIEEFYRLNGVRLKTNDLARLEEAYRGSGGSDGVFNVPEGISRADEWDVNIYRVAKREKTGEFVPLSKAEITLNRLGASPYARRGASFRSHTTLGQLAKQCDGVFIGVMSKIEGINGTDKFRIKQGEAPLVDITFQIETNLFGRLSADTATIPMLWFGGEEQVPENGIRTLVFYAQGYTMGFWDFAVNGFDWEKPPVKPDVPPAMLLENWNTSVRVLKTHEIEKTYIETVGGYLQLLRREKRDPDKYYEFLRPLVKSPVWRIRQDAKEDMLKLFGRHGPDRFDLRRVLNDPELDSGLLKDYVRYIAIPDREKQKTGTQKEE